LPFTADRTIKGAVVENFFDNLLPEDNRIRERARGRFHAASTGAFDLLTAIGRDCVGAVQLLPPDAPPAGFDRIEYEVLSDEQVERRLVNATSPLLGDAGDLDDDSWRISIAGAQEKTALLKVDGKWCTPKGATPTTHILKLPLGLIANQRADMTDSVHNEWLCLNILKEVGLPAAEAEVLTFGEQTVLSVERFDREWATSAGQRWIVRLPQEDLCQALGLPPTQKYEHTDGKGRTTGPTMPSVLKVLEGGAKPRQDVATFLLAQMMNWVLGNTDAHGKNFSVFLQRGATYSMTPVYDVISLWPIVGDAPNQLKQKAMKLAIPVRTQKTLRKLDDVTPADWFHAADRSGVPDLRDLVRRIAAEVTPAIQRVCERLPTRFPERLIDKILPRARARAQAIATFDLET
jgi:serine/threonine-protein kinase HipA